MGKLFSKAVVPFYVFTNSVWRFVTQYPCHHLGRSMLRQPVQLEGSGIALCFQRAFPHYWNWASLNLSVYHQSIFICLFVYLFMRDTEKERGRNTGRGRSRLPAGSLMWDLMWDPILRLLDLSRRQTLNRWTTQASRYSKFLIRLNYILTLVTRNEMVSWFFAQ